MPASTGRTTTRRQFGLTLLLGAMGAALALLAVRQSWARAVYQAPHPLPAQSVTISGQDLVPAAGALALAGLACLAAVIATRGLVRRAAGLVLALCGAGTAAALSGSLTTASVLAAASAKASSEASVAAGGAGSTTGGATTVGGAVVTGGSSAHAVLLGVPWRAAVLAGALAIIAAGLLTVWRGTRWPVMSTRYERSRGAAGRPGSDSAGPSVAGPAPAGPAPAGSAGSAGSAQDRSARANGKAADPAGPDPAAPDPATLDPAALWDSISRGDDPTESGSGDAGPDAATAGERAGRAAGGRAAG